MFGTAGSGPGALWMTAFIQQRPLVGEGSGVRVFQFPAFAGTSLHVLIYSTTPTCGRGVGGEGVSGLNVNDLFNNAARMGEGRRTLHLHSIPQIKKRQIKRNHKEADD
jgi:hypothetical protein